MSKRLKTVARPDWRSEWEARKAAYVADAWKQYMREPYQRLYAYYTPSAGKTWGEFYTVADGLEAPADGHLVDPEPIPCGTREQIARWLDPRVQRLPMLPIA
jgi:hypothetical protein